MYNRRWSEGLCYLGSYKHDLHFFSDHVIDCWDVNKTNYEYEKQQIYVITLTLFFLFLFRPTNRTEDDLDIIYSRLKELKAFEKYDPLLLQQICYYSYYEDLERGIIRKWIDLFFIVVVIVLLSFVTWSH